MVIRRAKQKQISFGYCDTRTGQRVYPPPPVDQMSDLLPEQLPPDQPPGSDPNIDVKLTCTPPLGQSTVLPRDKQSVCFTVLAETDISILRDGEEPQVCLWHNHEGQDDWTELPLKPSSGLEDTVLRINSSDQNRTWFTAELSGIPKDGHAVSFTLKYRIGSKTPWTWIKDTTGMEDGQLHYQASIASLGAPTDYDLGTFLQHISPYIAISREESETEDTQLFSLTCPVNAASGQDSGYQHHRLGKARNCARWFALVRLWPPWLAPRQGRGSKLELDKDGVLLSFLRDDGMHVVCLAISGIDDVLTTFITENEYGDVIIKGRNDREISGTSRVLVAVAESFEVANCAVMYHARKVISEYDASSSELADDTKEIKALTDEKVKPEWLEEWYDGLTYCTWNGLGQKLTSEKIMDALAGLEMNNINITNLIIDDNWQSLSAGESQFKRGWSDFEANPEGFPLGMKHTTSEIRLRYPNIKHIAVWHAILGYWGGIDPDGKIAKEYKCIEVEKQPGVAGGKFHVIAGSDAKRMYDDFYAFLADSGIDAVKTDAQFFLDLLLHAPDRRNMMIEYQDAWTIAHLKHFSSRAISCMSQFPQALFHSQLPQNKPRLLVRNSDDFFPEVEASHPWHIFCNAHNSILTQHLNALPDWDMFQTSHSWAGFHAAARCVSGGPIYFTDVPGEHDIELIHQMTALTPQRKRIILRPGMVGKSVDVYNGYEDPVLLRIGTFHGGKGRGSGILGVFNVGQGALREFVHLGSFPGTEEGEYVVGSFCSGEVSKPMKRGEGCDMVAIELGKQGWDILTAYAVRTFTVREKEVGVSIMGLLGKMTGAAAVSGTDIYVESNGRLRIWVQIKALGVLGLWIGDLEQRTVEDDFMVMILGQPVPVGCVSKSKKSKQVLEVDVERAWKEMGLQAGWSNETAVEVFVH